MVRPDHALTLQIISCPSCLKAAFISSLKKYSLQLKTELEKLVQVEIDFFINHEKVVETTNFEAFWPVDLVFYDGLEEQEKRIFRLNLHTCSRGKKTSITTQILNSETIRKDWIKEGILGPPNQVRKLIEAELLQIIPFCGHT
jgi:hypothetical protein